MHDHWPCWIAGGCSHCEKNSWSTECKRLCQLACKGQRGSASRRLLMYVVECNPTAIQTPNKTLRDEAQMDRWAVGMNSSRSAYNRNIESNAYFSTWAFVSLRRCWSYSISYAKTIQKSTFYFFLNLYLANCSGKWVIISSNGFFLFLIFNWAELPDSHHAFPQYWHWCFSHHHVLIRRSFFSFILSSTGCWIREGGGPPLPGCFPTYNHQLFTEQLWLLWSLCGKKETK